MTLFKSAFNFSCTKTHLEPIDKSKTKILSLTQKSEYAHIKQGIKTNPIDLGFETHSYLDNGQRLRKRVYTARSRQARFLPTRMRSVSVTEQAHVCCFCVSIDLAATTSISTRN